MSIENVEYQYVLGNTGNLLSTLKSTNKILFFLLEILLKLMIKSFLLLLKVTYIIWDPGRVARVLE